MHLFPTWMPAEAQARDLVTAVAATGWSMEAVPKIVERILGSQNEAAVAALQFGCQEVVPRLARTSDEITAIMHALDGGYVPAGPSGSPLRGLINVLPTGRNFYSVDPKAIPSRLAYQTGQAMAESLLQRHLDETGSIHSRSDCRSGAHRPCGPAATTLLKCWHCSALCQFGTRRLAG